MSLDESNFVLRVHPDHNARMPHTPEEYDDWIKKAPEQQCSDLAFIPVAGDMIYDYKTHRELRVLGRSQSINLKGEHQYISIYAVEVYKNR